jgi:hypothetical protein
MIFSLTEKPKAPFDKLFFQKSQKHWLLYEEGKNRVKIIELQKDLEIYNTKVCLCI